ncbi:O-acetyl-ADP-ribose deacetylase [Microbacterium sp. NEAU-LLC]|uniref:O-acetyl-ADP-ribose deacetylase n=1 Tax=Microbacterium helvum TaxID=2773713 RepID=A0ABR8NPX0_9MICO|nr:O-acetyl-ADP-ribose deacetylase [Microbacterium helvum]MBD3942695.1 O-acetyl-ADP-ribose deacetylase [Microbacterium helvum]
MPSVTAVHGDITAQQVDAIVNAANRRMRGGGGVDGAIHRAGGPAILADCIARFPSGLATGDAGWTTAGDLPAAWVIHTVGPNHAAGERDRALLESCYRRALEVADELDVASIAFPLISAGVYAWPLDDAIAAAIETIARTSTRVEHVRLVSFSEPTHRRVQAQVIRSFPPPTEPGSIGRLFDEEPPVWGLRGDPYLWRALRAQFAGTPLPSDRRELQRTITSAAEAIAGAPVADRDDAIYVAEFNPGHGMSAGHISASWWNSTGFPLLIDRFEGSRESTG